MLDPKTSLAIDAPPIAPYDDGFSTDSEDFNTPEEHPYQSPDSPLSTHCSNSVRSAVVTENQSKIQQQQTRAEPHVNPIKQDSEVKLSTTTVAAVKIEENTSNQGTDDHKTHSNGHINSQEVVQAVAMKTGEKEEEHCRNCKGYLPPLGERLKMMQTAALQQVGKGPPPSRQCSCCHITYPFVALTDESRNKSCAQPRCYMCNWAVKAAKRNGVVEVTGVKRMLDGTVKGMELSGECCKSCRGKLTPLSQRLEMMKQATLHHKGPGPPPSRQCSCCHITQPILVFGLKGREPTCSAPICQMCEAASTSNGKTDEGSSHNTAELNGNGSSALMNNTTTAVKSELDIRMDGIYCRNCKRKVPLFVEKPWRISRPNRQCTCCSFTLPLASFPEESRSVMCATPICSMCNEARTHTSVMEEKASSSSVVAANDGAKVKYITSSEVKKAPETIVIESSEDEEGELVEDDICECCGGKLIPLGKRLQMMKDAAQVHGGKGPPPSRQCACCRITYPSAALTQKSRKMTRVVPICLNCCKSGGSAIYEMLAASDEFFEAFKVENPDMARQLVQKKSNGSLTKAVDAQKKRLKKQVKETKLAPTSQPRHKQGHTEMMKQTRPVQPSQATHHQRHRELASHPCYRPQPMMARKSLPAPRLIIGSWRQLMHSSTFVDYRPQTARECINTPRLIIRNPLNSSVAVSQIGGHAEAGASAKHHLAGHEATHLQAPRSRTARWLKQFELVNGKTVRERRLEARNRAKERQLEKIRQRTGQS